MIKETEIGTCLFSFGVSKLACVCNVVLDVCV